MKKRKWISILFMGCLCTLLMPFRAYAKDTGISITIPSDGETNISSGRSFYVMGTFEDGTALKDGDEVKVELKDTFGRVVRTVSSTIMNNTSMYIDYPGLSYYGDDKTELLEAGMPDLIWDGENEESFYNGDRKLYYNDHEFAALIPGGEGQISEQSDLVDANGKPYSPLEDGEYIICVTVTDKTDIKKDGTDATGTAEKRMTIGADKNKILSRFSPEMHMERVKAFAEANNYKIYLDLFPGYWSKGDVFCEILPRWRAADASEYMEGTAHFIIYNVKESSATYSVEIPIMQKMGIIDDSERMQYYYYEYGEPVLPDAAGTRSEIVKFPEGDKLQFVRAETMLKETAGTDAVEYDLNLTDGIAASIGETVSLYGVTALIQLDADDIIDNGDNSYQLLNKIRTIRYHIMGEGIDISFEEEVNLNRKSGEWDNYSTLEFKHDIPITENMQGKILTVDASGFDTYGTLVAGTTEQFMIIVAGENAAPSCRNVEFWMFYIILAVIAGVVTVLVLMMERKQQ